MDRELNRYNSIKFFYQPYYMYIWSIIHVIIIIAVVILLSWLWLLYIIFQPLERDWRRDARVIWFTLPVPDISMAAVSSAHNCYVISVISLPEK